MTKTYTENGWGEITERAWKREGEGEWEWKGDGEGKVIIKTERQRLYKSQKGSNEH